ncbi:hypothetical protein P7C73_g1706, partial [Tremellales sp. Uapishka_1]
MRFTSIFSTLALLSVALAADRGGLRARKPHALQTRKAARTERLEKSARDAELAEHLSKRASSKSDFRYYSNKTSDYFVESLPEVPFDLGELYSGLIPLDWSNKSEALFFFFQPTVGDPVDEITIWLNGGPGCSSLEGFFQENGRFTWQPGTFAPVENPYSWVNLTNMLWVEYPIGTGFSVGTVTADNEEAIAQDFLKFFKNFENLFGISNYKIYVTGESYAGRYVPYVSAAMLDANDTTHFNLSGEWIRLLRVNTTADMANPSLASLLVSAPHIYAIPGSHTTSFPTGALVYDPCIGEFDGIQEEYTAYPLIEANANLFNFNESFMANLKEMHQQCGYEAYISKYLTFPPAGVQPPSFFNYTSNATCDVFDSAFAAALQINPCFDIYEINTQCPLLYDVLDFPGSLFYDPVGSPQVYFNRSDVKKAIHAPDYINWMECAEDPVFTGGDGGPEVSGDFSKDPIQGVLPQVIEATNRVLVANGDFDMIIITNGTLLSIQNMTWNGQLGFQSQPSSPIVVNLPELQYLDVFQYNGYSDGDGAQGVMGVSHYERGLMWAETFQSGHMQPQYQARVSYRHLQWVLGRIDSL